MISKHTKHPCWVRLWSVCAIAAALSSAGCDSGAPPPAETAAITPVAPSAAAAAEEPLLVLPERGVATLELDRERITLAANGVPARELLDRLRALLRFELEVSGGVILPRSVTVRMAEASIDDVLNPILFGLPYSLYYDVDPDDSSRILSRLLVGRAESDDFALAALEPERKKPRLSEEQLAQIRRERTPEVIAERYERNQEAWYDDLYDPDPGNRADAAEAIYLDERTFPILTDLLSNDPDPRVRAAAAGTLADDLDNPSAADALLVALNDSNSEVVIEALDALEDVGDASNIADIQPLLLHRDSEVREAAIDAIEWLED